MTSPAVARRAACPACGAATRLGDPWCTLCYAELRGAGLPVTPANDQVPVATVAQVATAPVATAPVATAPVAVAQVATEPVVGTSDASAPLFPPDSPLAGVTLPCPACEAPNPVMAQRCSICRTDLLAPLRTSAGINSTNPLVREFAALSRGNRIALAVGIALTIVMIVYGGLTVIG